MMTEGHVPLDDGGMRWGKLRPWFALVGPLLAVVVLTAAPVGVKAGELPWPKWLVAGVVAAGGVLVAVWTPLVKARADALVARTTRAAERDAQAEAALNRVPTLKGRVLLVRDVTDRALLGIHEAIPLPAESASEQGLSTELPTYVLRDIDADLRTKLGARPVVLCYWLDRQPQARRVVPMKPSRMYSRIGGCSCPLMLPRCPNS